MIRRLIPRLGEFRTGILGSVCLSIGLVLIGIVAQAFFTGNGSLILLMSVLPVSVLGMAGVTPALQSILSRGGNESEQGEILGLGQSMSALARICGPIAGYGLVQLELTLWPYWSGAVLMLVVAFLISRISYHFKDSVEENRTGVDAVAP